MNAGENVALKEEQGLGKLLDISADAVVLMDERDRIVFWNHAAERVFGYTRDEALKMGVSDLMPVASRQAHMDGIARFVRTGEPVLVGKTVEVEALKKDGTVFPVELSIAAERREGAWTFFSIIRDITKRKKDEEDLKAKTAMLDSINTELKLLLDVSISISRTIDMDTLLKDIIATITRLELFHLDKKGGIFIVEDGRMRLKSYVGHTDWFVGLHKDIKVGECLCGLAAKTGEIITSRSSENDPRHTIKSDIDDHAHIILPLIAECEVLGVLYLYLAPGTVIEEKHKSTLSAIGNLVGVAINNSRLYEKTKELSLYDPLTGLANRRLLFIELDRVMAKARRHGTPFSLIMMDLDHFKKYNDARGHIEGDRLLVDFASILSASTRETDLGVRYGGEEFLALLPDTDGKTAAEVAERIRMAVEQRCKVTVSLGVASWNAGVTDREDIIDMADEALYRAKCNGRNRVETPL